ncbi:glycosyltransferase group 2 family protein [Bacteroides sp. CAG:443]|nr:glycosyltransferase group 2 family protein [Bacteroides sp. CAG:443]
MGKIINEKRIAILMATYNGEKFLKEQIDSILGQTNQDWTLYIQDDGSLDRTIDIINRYEDSRIVIVDSGLTHQGAGMNFMSLLNMIESEYYMFCDQDDVWFNNKIEVEYQRMIIEEKKHSKSTPIIVHTSRTFTDADLNIKLENEFNPKHLPKEIIRKKIEKLKNPNILAIYTIVGGCTMMLNVAVKKIVFPYINVRVHDSVCAMAVANSGGIISTIIEPTMFYRIHNTNTCGVTDSRLLPKILHIYDSYKRNIKGYYIWKIYGKGSFVRFLYYRIKYFFCLRFN